MVDRSRRYTSEEVAQIVRESLTSCRSEQQFTLTYDDLKDVAEQCGVDHATLERTLQTRELASAKETIRRRWRAKALASLSLPSVACLAFVAMNLHGGGFPWAIFPIVFWLLPMLSRSKSRLFPSDELLTKAAKRFKSAYSTG